MGETLGLLSLFIREHVDAIVSEWEKAASPSLPPGRGTQDLLLRGRDLLAGIAGGMEHRHGDSTSRTHAAPSRTSPADLPRLLAEFQALGASVLACWRASGQAHASPGDAVLEEWALFQSGLDGAFAEAVRRHTDELAASRDMFQAVLGDEVRSQLTGIDLSAFLLSRPALAEVPRREAAARIRRATREIGRRTTDLLEFAQLRLGSAGVPLARSACDLGLLCEQAVEEMHLAHPGRPLSMPPLPGGLGLEADAPRLLHALCGLLDHAARHAHPGTPLQVALRPAVPGLRQGTVAVEIAYRAPPFTAEGGQQPFEPVVRGGGRGAGDGHADAPSRHPGQSQGLGLFVAREVVLAHGGTVEVESAVASGKVVFTLRLPQGAAR